VLAVHGGVAGDVARHPAHGKLKRVLLATDFSSCADEARRAVAALAKLAVARICVVHVGSGGSVEKAVRWKLDRVTAALRRQGIEADGADLTGEPVEAILAHAAGWEADVIAVGTKGRRGLSRLVLGSVAEGLLRRAGCPVLVVKKAVPLVRACGPGGRGRNTR
jgi:nucleotide-binding universal stress UspA family protein